MVQQRLISISVYQECYLLVHMSMQINLQHVFKMFASRTHAQTATASAERLKQH